jgi:hypothetical protein
VSRIITRVPCIPVTNTPLQGARWLARGGGFHGDGIIAGLRLGTERRQRDCCGEQTERGRKKLPGLEQGT